MELDRKISKLIKTHNKVLFKLAPEFYCNGETGNCYSDKCEITFGRHWVKMSDNNPLLSLMREYKIPFIKIDTTTIYECMKKDTDLKFFTRLFLDKDDNIFKLEYIGDKQEIYNIAYIENCPKEMLRCDKIKLKEMENIYIPLDLENKLFIPLNEDGYIFEYTNYLTRGVTKTSEYKIYEVENEDYTKFLFVNNIDDKLKDVRPFVFSHIRDNMQMYHLYLIVRRKKHLDKVDE